MRTAKKHHILLAIFTCMNLLLANSAYAKVDYDYNVTDLGPVQGNKINNNNYVAGEDFNSMSAFIWDDVNGIQSLGTLGGMMSSAYAINDNNAVVGYSYTTDWEEHAFIWDETNGMRDLGTLGGNVHSAANAINANNVVAGKSVTTDMKLHAFIWDEVNGMQDLGTLGGRVSIAEDINIHNEVVGHSHDETMSGLNGFIWDEVNGMQNIGNLGGIETFAYAINDNGQVVGYSHLSDTAPYHYHAFIWDETNGMRDLGTLDGGNHSVAYDINNNGEIVGEATIGSEDYAFVYSKNKLMNLNDLVDPGFTTILRSAESINDNGVIIASGVKDDGRIHTFMLTPVIKKQKDK